MSASSTAGLGGHDDLGAYLLGGLTEVERTAFEGHLLRCAGCRREKARLAGPASRLDALSAAEANHLMSGDPARTAAGQMAEDAVPKAGIPLLAVERGTEKLLQHLGSRRSRTRRRLLAVAAAAALVGGAAGADIGTWASRSEPAPDASYALASEHGVQAQVGLDRRAWGTQVSLTASRLPTSGLLEMWIVDSSGKADRACAWSATGSGTSSITGAVPVDLHAIDRVQIRSGDRSILAEVRVAAAGTRGDDVDLPPAG